MQEEDRNRYKILIAGGTEVFERMQGNISTFNARNMTLIGIILATLSIILTLLLFLLRQMGIPFSNVDWILLSLFCLFSVISLVITTSLSIPTEYKDLAIFEQKRFDELLRMDEQTLLSDFLYHLKDAYDYNLDKYKNLMRWFTFALCSFIIADITFVILVAKNII